jgi:phosphoribosylaminoimidazole carboxylase PurE protein
VRDRPLVGILAGSESDLPVLEEAVDVLRRFGVPFELTVASAHRSPERCADYARRAAERGLRVLIAAAGGAAHLAGVVAAHTTLPVIGVPLDATGLGGLDALLSTVQMPPGVPVATVAIGRWGARNAAWLAVQILALSDERLARLLREEKANLARRVEEQAARVAERLVE